MKIQSKISITSLTLIIGLLISSGLLFSRFYTIYQFKNFQQNMMNLEYSIIRIMDKNLTLYTERDSSERLITLWKNDEQEFRQDLDQILNNKLNSKFSNDYQKIHSTVQLQWNERYENLISFLETELDNLSISVNGIVAPGKNLYILYEETLLSGNQELASNLGQVRERMYNTYIFLSTFSQTLDRLFNQADQEISRYIRESVFLTTFLVFIIFLSDLILGFRVSKSLVKRINETNTQVDAIAQGTLNFSEYKEDRDEFDQVIKEYYTFSEILSDKLDSLKYLLQDIGNSLGTETDIQQLQETIVELGMDSLKADSGMLFLADPETSTLKLVQRTGFCPPPFILDKSTTMNRQNVEEFLRLIRFAGKVPYSESSWETELKFL